MLPKFRPPTHPGEMLLEEFLKPIGISQRAFAKHLGWTYARLNEIINKHRKITVSSALSLADALGTTPEFWLDLQQQHDLWHETKKHTHIETLPQLAELTSLHP